MKKLLSIILGTLMLVGCANSNNTKAPKTPVINENQSIYIMLPDTSNVAQTYVLQGELKTNFQKFSKAKVSTALDPSSVKNGLIEAQKQKADLLVCPMITQWRDGNTPITGTQDKVGVNIRIFDVKTQEVIDEQNLYKRSNLFAFKDNAPDRLLPSIIRRYVTLLYK